MTARAWLPAAAVLAITVGCGEDGVNPPPPPPQPLEVALGGASDDGTGFTTLAGDVTLVPGGQGGFHVWMKYRVTGAGAETLDIAYTARRVSDDRLILTNMRRQDLAAPGSEGYWESPVAIPAFMCPSPIGIAVQDQPLRFKLEVRGLDGTVRGTATTEATPHCPAGDQAVFCANICNG